MEINKQLFEDVLSGKLKGTFVLRNGNKYNTSKLKRNINKRTSHNYPYTLYKGNSVFICYTINGKNGFCMVEYENDIVDFIPDTNMKENDKRTIQISLQQAREWYNSGNDTLRMLALSSFSKEEIDPYPRSWEEWKKLHPNNHLIIQAPGKEFCDKLIAYSAVLLLREEWIHIWSQEQGLEKDWNLQVGNVIRLDVSGNIFVTNELTISPLKFPTRELAVDFKNTFKFLLEKAKGLY